MAFHTSHHLSSKYPLPLLPGQTGHHLHIVRYLCFLYGWWTVGLNFSGTDWRNYKSVGRVDSVADMSYKIGLGGEYTPEANAVRKYFRRVTYRLGAYYGTDYVLVRNTPLNYYAVTFGLGLPFKRYTDKVNAGFEIGSLGTTSNGLLKESFFKCTVGITLNDKWFIKRRYD